MLISDSPSRFYVNGIHHHSSRKVRAPVSITRTEYRTGFRHASLLEVEAGQGHFSGVGLPASSSVQVASETSCLHVPGQLLRFARSRTRWAVNPLCRNVRITGRQCNTGCYFAADCGFGDRHWIGFGDRHLNARRQTVFADFSPSGKNSRINGMKNDIHTTIDRAGRIVSPPSRCACRRTS